MTDILALPWDLIGRILLAALLGAIVGVERDLAGRPAGLRTNMVIAVSSCLFTIISREGFLDAGNRVDIARVAAGIVIGVGFLGAGALMHQKNTILGLTTAADIWLVAAMGMAIGVGMYALGIFVALFTVVALILLAPLSHWIERCGERRRGKI